MKNLADESHRVPRVERARRVAIGNGGAAEFGSGPSASAGAVSP